jgi:hypothetical protein
MFTWQEITDLFAAISGNVVSLSSGVLGVIFTVISVWLPNKQKRYAFTFGILALLLSPIYAWRDEYRNRREESARSNDEKKTLTEQFQNELKKFRTEERFQRALLRPNIFFSFTYNPDGAGWVMSNVGPGIAVVKWFSVSVDGVPQRDWRDAMRAVGVAWQGYLITFSIPHPNEAIPIRQTPSVLLWYHRPVPEKLANIRDRVRLDICYCSMLDECWQMSDRFGDSPKSSSCTPEPKIILRSPPAS